jgi:hypothetical protein
MPIISSSGMPVSEAVKERAGQLTIHDAGGMPIRFPEHPESYQNHDGTIGHVCDCVGIPEVGCAIFSDSRRRHRCREWIRGNRVGNRRDAVYKFLSCLVAEENTPICACTYEYMLPKNETRNLDAAMTE